MKASRVGWWVTALLLSLTTESLSQECSPSSLDNQNNTKWTINSQYDLDNLSNDCTTLNGDLEIGSAYSGDVKLDRVSTITGELSVASTNVSSENTTRSITYFHLPNLTTLGSLYLSLPDQYLTFVDLPNLISVGSLSVVNVQSSLWAPKLLSAETIDLNGADELDLSSLETVTNKLTLCSTPECLPTTGIPIQALFPALHNVTDARIIGKLSSLDLSSLTYAYVRRGAAPRTQDSGLLIEHYGSPMKIDLPRLGTVTGLLGLSGDISNFSIPELEVTQAEIRISASTALDVRLEDLEDADSVVLEGSIASAEFPALKSINNLVINSTMNMSCQGFRDARQRAYYDVTTHSRDGDMSCKSNSSDGVQEFGEDDLDDDEGGLSSAALGGIAIGVTAFVVLGSVGAAMWILSVRRKKKPPGQGSVELMERQRQTRRQRERMRMGAADERPGTPPPPYTPPAPEYEEVDPNRDDNGDANANEDGSERRTSYGVNRRNGNENNSASGHDSNERSGTTTG